MTIKALLFDRDGTLLDLDATWSGVCYKLIKHMSDGDVANMQAIAEVCRFELKQKRFLDGSPILTHSPETYLPDWARVSGSTYDQYYLEKFSKAVLEFSTDNVAPFPDMQTTINHLHQMGLPLGIATNGTEKSARRQMQALSLEDRFCFIVGSDSGHGGKPDPGQILAFANLLDIEPEEIAMVGDSLHDMEAAQAAGALAIGVPTGAIKSGELARHADQMIASLSDLTLLFQPDEMLA